MFEGMSDDEILAAMNSSAEKKEYTVEGNFSFREQKEPKYLCRPPISEKLCDESGFLSQKWKAWFEDVCEIFYFGGEDVL